MKLLLYFVTTTFSLTCLCAQVGINTETPNSTLSIKGSLEAAYREVTTNTTLTENDHYITYSGSDEATITLPAIGSDNQSFTGRIYKIKNISSKEITLVASDNNSLRLKADPITSFTIKSGGYIEAVNNANTTGGTWDISFVGHPSTIQNLEFYSAILKIPPHANAGGGVPDWNNHGNTNYDSDGWYIIQKESRAPSTNHAPVMKLVYEYQGTPFNLTNMAPMLTTGVNANNPDVFTASVMSILNNGTNGKTRLTIAFSRNDYFVETNSAWAATFNLYLLLVRNNVI